MSRRFMVWTLALCILTVFLPALVGCGATPAPTAAPTIAPTAVQQTQPPAATATTASKPTNTAVTQATATQGPTVGGTLRWALTGEPDTLDIHRTSNSNAGFVCHFIGASLVAQDQNGNYVPYLAESWKVSEDGKVWDFALKKGVKFHDGNMLTATDWVYTIKRAIDPATKSPNSGPSLGPIASAEEVDSYTLRITMKSAFAPLLYGLSDPAYMPPFSKAAVDKWGDTYGRHPVSVGPFVFKEWTTGQKITLERNPDFIWGPRSITSSGPVYLQSIEYRVIPEVATVVAGLEAGEIDFAAVAEKDYQRLIDSGKVQFFDPDTRGMYPALFLNNSKPPFNDLNVRKAFNMAVDRPAMIKAIAAGKAVVQYGPLSPSMPGYWSGVEQIGYNLDLAKAKALMAEAGYTVGPGGMLQKDGQPFKVILDTASVETSVKVAEMVKEQLKALGVEVEIRARESSALSPELRAGNYAFSVVTRTEREPDSMFLNFHSSQAGVYNVVRPNDPELDKILESTRAAMDPAKRQEVVNQAQKYIVEHALIVPLYMGKTHFAVNKAFKNVQVWTKTIRQVVLNDAYYQP